ncbi:MAG: EAL domain-containing protein [Alphaproteobacteria bacterium]|nr:EAL domain-containing protein [Alphaproteobacteria bacterium]
MPKPDANSGPASPGTPSAATGPDGLIESEALDLVGMLSAFDESAYVWDLHSDSLLWEENAPAVLGLDGVADISTGKHFENRIVPEHRARRLVAVTNSTSCPHDRGVPYRVQYRFRPGALRGIASIWLEDHGRWWPDIDGKPIRARGTIRVVNESFVAEQAALYGSDSDEMTNQLNRTRLPQAIAAVLGRAEHRQTSSAFLMIAVNNLASVNETFGFDIGDEVLNATAKIVKGKLRSGDLLGRYSSNKFGVIVSNCGAGAMRIAAERFMQAVRQTPINTSACQLTATISVGGVTMPDQAGTVRQVFSRSLHALDAAKSRRFDSFVGFAADTDHESIRQRRITIADDIMSALDDDRMRLVLQPIINSTTRKADLYECLLRMEKPDGSIVSAGEFIPFAEQFGLLRLIDRRTLELSVALLRKHPRLSLSVNVSSMTTTDQDWLATLQNLSGNDRSLTKRLVLEITETKVIDDIDQAIAFVDTLREMGCRVAIDDFGAGYTSFKNLKHLPVDLVKIDGAFVKNLSVDSSDKIFIKTMVELAETFGMETVAEWVGDEETADILTKAGITYLQGFHFGQPIPAGDLPDDL